MIFLLIIIFCFKHFIADFLLQGEYMLGKFKPSPDYVLPLLTHVMVHGAFTLAIASAFHCGYAPYLAVLDATIHFIMDRIKASPDMLGRYDALSKNEMKNILSYIPTLGKQGVRERFGAVLKSNKLFWYSLGLDQLVHHLTDVLMVYLIWSLR